MRAFKYLMMAEVIADTKPFGMKYNSQLNKSYMALGHISLLPGCLL